MKLGAAFLFLFFGFKSLYDVMRGKSSDDSDDEEEIEKEMEKLERRLSNQDLKEKIIKVSGVMIAS